MLSVLFILAATLTLLPAVLAKLGPRVDKGALPWVAPRRAPPARPAAWGERLWRHPLAFGATALVTLVLALPVLGLKTAMPSIKVVPSGDSSRAGYDAVQRRSARARRGDPDRHDADRRRPASPPRNATPASPG